jgi:hypothetical protein
MSKNRAIFRYPNDATVKVTRKDRVALAKNQSKLKTATHLRKARKVSLEFNIPYVAKCDSDTVIRLQKMLNFLHQELSTSLQPVSIVLKPGHNPLWLVP